MKRTVERTGAVGVAEAVEPSLAAARSVEKRLGCTSVMVPGCGREVEKIRGGAVRAARLGQVLKPAAQRRLLAAGQ